MERPVPIPTSVRAEHKGWEAELAYMRARDVSTWCLRRADETRYLKVARGAAGFALRRESERLNWARPRLPVPRVIEYDSTDGFHWLLTEALPGRDATDDRLRAAPSLLVPLLAHGLRMIHNTSADDCPYVLGLEEALHEARRRVAEGLVDTAEFGRRHRGLTPADALVELATVRPACEDRVLCHGDYCLPNVLIHEGAVSGFVDLGDIKLSDRWSDLAIATQSISRNLGSEWEIPFLEAYGIEQDEQRTRYFRLLCDLLG